MLAIWALPETWLSLATLTAMEVVLGVDNIVFLTILAGKLPRERQATARRLGLAAALGTRLLLLLALSWLMGLTADLFRVFGQGISGRDLILAGGGLFLVAKATYEIHEKLEIKPAAVKAGPAPAGAFWLVIAQIAVLDVVFSLDSVITAVGMARHLPVMIAAMVVAMLVMLAFAGTIGSFVERHPTMKILALSFLILIGVLLVAEGFERHLQRGYVYFAMAFAFGVELVNIRVRKVHDPVHLHSPYEPDGTGRG